MFAYIFKFGISIDSSSEDISTLFSVITPKVSDSITDSIKNITPVVRQEIFLNAQSMKIQSEKSQINSVSMTVDWPGKMMHKIQKTEQQHHRHVC